MNTELEMLAHLRLQYHVKHANLESCWEDGYQLAQQEMPEENNPHPSGSLEHEYWDQGWWAGFYQEPMLFAKSSAEINTLSKPQVIPAKTLTSANESNFSQQPIKLWATRALKVAGAVAATWVVIELIELAS